MDDDDEPHLEVIDYMPLANELCEGFARAHAQLQMARRCGVKRKIDVACGGAGSGIGGTCAGDVAIRKILATLESFSVTRTNSQKLFHKCFLTACLPQIYGTADFEKHRERIMKQFEVEEVRYECLVVTPRRWGKTYSVAMFVAALLWCSETMWISCFSTGQRASSSLLDKVGDFLAELPGYQDRLIKKNQEQIFIKGNRASDVRRFYSYPSSVAVRTKTPVPAHARTHTHTRTHVTEGGAGPPRLGASIAVRLCVSRILCTLFFCGTLWLWQSYSPSCERCWVRPTGWPPCCAWSRL